MSSNGSDQNTTKPTTSQRIWDVISSPTFVGLLVFSFSLIGIGILIWVVVTKLSTGMGLPLLALSSVLLLLAALLVFTTLIHLIGLSDLKSALGLPEGSVRALLALALLGLFSVMASSVLPGPTGSGQPPDDFAKQMLTLRWHSDDGGHFILFRFFDFIIPNRFGNYVVRNRFSDYPARNRLVDYSIPNRFAYLAPAAGGCTAAAVSELVGEAAPRGGRSTVSVTAAQLTEASPAHRRSPWRLQGL